MNKRQKPDGSFDGPAADAKARYGGIGKVIDNGGEFSWADVDSALLSYAISVVTNHGDAISFAVNRSRSAGSITILAGPDRFKYYPETKIEAQALLTQIIQGE